jgi:hypothetical protein
MSYLDSIGKGLSNVQLSSNICSTLLMQSPTSNYTKSSQEIPANTCTSIEIPAIGKIVDNNPSNALPEDLKIFVFSLLGQCRTRTNIRGGFYRPPLTNARVR